MSQTIKTTMTDSHITDDGILAANVAIISGMNLSEEFAITAAQYALSTETGCDLDQVEALLVEADFMGTSDIQWLVSFCTTDEGYEG